MIKKLILTLPLLFLLLIFPSYTHGDTVTDYTNKLQDNLRQQQEVQAKIKNAQNTRTTLSNQITLIDSQIRLTELKIEETQTNIERLGGDISDLGVKLSRLGDSLDHLTSVSQQRIRSIHEQSFIQPFEFFLDNQGFNELVTKYKYLEIVRSEDLKVLEQMKATQTTYNDQKNLLQDKKTEQESFKVQLQRQKTSLAQQKADKNRLIVITRNDESKFQKLLAQLKSDADSIQRALQNLGLSLGPVKKGQVIGLMGNTGCSSGPHLHFEVYKDAKVQGGQVVDINTLQPVQFQFTSHLVNPHGYIDTGILSPPLAGYPSQVTISTEFGQVYFLGVHTGLDLYPTAKPGQAGEPILATGDGIAYPASDSHACYLTGTIGKGVVIDHQNGLVTLYWHLQ